MRGQERERGSEVVATFFHSQRRAKQRGSNAKNGRNKMHTQERDGQQEMRGLLVRTCVCVCVGEGDYDGAGERGGCGYIAT